LDFSVFSRGRRFIPHTFHQPFTDFPYQSFRDRTQFSDSAAASRNPRTRSIRVSPAVIRVVIVNMGLKPFAIMRR
jgi:hypothetical protein